MSEHDTLQQAAKQLHRTPAALSLSLKRLEEALSGKLFEGDRKQHLTPLGDYVRAQARAAWDTFEVSRQNIQRYANGEKGRIKIAAVPSMTTQILPAAIGKMVDAAPDVHIDLHDMDSASVVDAVINQRIDIGFASLPQARLGLEINAECLIEDRFVAIFKPGHPLSHCAAPLSWEAIGHYDFISNGLCEQFPSEAIQALCQRARMSVHNTASLAAFVRAGFGVTLLPQLACALMPDLTTAPLADQSVVRRLYALSRYGQSLAPITAQLLANVREVCVDLHLTQG